ncbi:hypothetical protein HG15A2_42110 [Adhaeretor mobilis]|uniref:Uncharacterized protein n=1 Tax=Adhaeretor mobilis TaxID=1930276 RepID=A0A517N153_9BACT|nr:hypothetical protein HG15A2_42110 [Adhaeretor mobilis]
MANVLENFEAGREVFELLTDLGTDPATLVPASWARFTVEIVFDLNSL